MLNKDKIERSQVEFFSIDDFVPQDHLLRKIDSVLDFTKIYDFVSGLYCSNNGRPSIDPIVLFKMVLIQHIYGITSLRKTAEEVKMNVAYRWFLGYLMNEQTPHFSTISYNFKHRFTEDTIEKIFYWILSEIEKANLLSPEAVFIDGTHIKANANIKKKIKKAIPTAAKIYEEKLLEEINEDRENNNKKPFDKKDKKEEKIINESTTDPESGVFHKGEHKKCFAYEAHTGCDKNGYIMGVTITAGNIHDSVAFDELYDNLTEHFKEIETVVADAGYKTPWICKRIIDDGRVPSLPYKRPMGNSNFMKTYSYVYDEYYDCVICPQNQVLKYTTTNRDGYKEFKSNPEYCKKCEKINECTRSKNHQKVVTKHIWMKYLELAEDYRHTKKYKDLYEMRKETIERVFADAKEKHAMRYTPYRGLAQVSKWVKLKFACMNLKKMALHIKKNHRIFENLSLIEYIFTMINPVSNLKLGLSTI